MVFLTPSQIQSIKEHMTEDLSVLTKKFKAKKTPYETRSISLNELDDYLHEGWEEVSTSKHKAKIQNLNQQVCVLKMISGACSIISDSEY